MSIRFDQVQVSTLRKYAAGLGGEIQISVVINTVDEYILTQ